jgi:hypothetical protein
MVEGNGPFENGWGAGAKLGAGKKLSLNSGFPLLEFGCFGKGEYARTKRDPKYVHSRHPP